MFEDVPNVGLFGIYRILSPSGSMYVGMTGKSFKERWTGHVKYLQQNRHPNNGLTRAFHKYGKSSLTFEILEIVNDHSILLEKEVGWWDNFHSLGLKLYNGRPTGTGSVFHTAETIEKIKKARNAQIDADPNARRNKLCVICEKRLGKELSRNRYCKSCSAVARKSSMRFEVELVKKLYLEKKLTTRELGEHFGISQQSAYRILKELKILIPKHKDYKG